PRSIKNTRPNGFLKLLNLHTERRLGNKTFLCSRHKTSVGVNRYDIFQLYKGHVIRTTWQRYKCMITQANRLRRSLSPFAINLSDIDNNSQFLFILAVSSTRRSLQTDGTLCKPILYHGG